MGCLLVIMCAKSDDRLLLTIHAEVIVQTYINNEKVLTETQTLRAGYSKAEPKFSPHHRPPS